MLACSNQAPVWPGESQEDEGVNTSMLCGTQGYPVPAFHPFAEGVLPAHPQLQTLKHAPAHQSHVHAEQRAVLWLCVSPPARLEHLRMSVKSSWPSAAYFKMSFQILHPQTGL